MGPIVDSLIFMRTATRTRDDKDLQNPYKRFPSWPCFDVLHDYLLREPALFVEKSRTMLCTWWATGECLHHVMVNQPASCIFWCPDMDRAQQCMDYCWVWHEQMDERLKAVFPLDRPKERQAKYRMELRGGGWLIPIRLASLSTLKFSRRFSIIQTCSSRSGCDVAACRESIWLYWDCLPGRTRNITNIRAISRATW